MTGQGARPATYCSRSGGASNRRPGVRLLLNPYSTRTVRRLENLADRGSMPSYSVGSCPRIWGLTAFILDAVLRNALAPTLGLPCAHLGPPP